MPHTMHEKPHNQPGPWNVSLAADTDLTKILDVQRRVYSDMYGHNHSDTSTTPTFTIDDIRREFSQSVFLKATVDGSMVGLVCGSVWDGTGRIRRLAVLPDYRGMGIESALLAAIEGHLVRFGAERFEFFTGISDDDGHYLFTKRGYTPIKNEKLTEQLSVVHMHKDLNAVRSR